jgi:two-component system, NarL family, nitrate/nitrite response regulator NarL
MFGGFRLLRPHSHIWILDDHHLRRAGMVGLLSEWAQENSATLHTADAVEEVTAAARADVKREAQHACLLGLGSASLDDAEVWADIDDLLAALGRQPLVIVPERISRDHVLAALSHGVRGVIPTRMSPDMAIIAIELILGGGSYFPHEGLEEPTRRARVRTGQTSRYRREPQVHPEVDMNGSIPAAVAVSSPNTQPEAAGLTARQKEVMKALTFGHSNKEIARLLQVSEATIKIHVRQLIRKLGVVNRTQVALLASQDKGGESRSHNGTQSR